MFVFVHQSSFLRNGLPKNLPLRSVCLEMTWQDWHAQRLSWVQSSSESLHQLFFVFNMKRSVLIEVTYFLALHLKLCWYLCGQQQLTHYEFRSALHKASQQKHSKKKTGWWLSGDDCTLKENDPRTPKLDFKSEEKSFEKLHVFTLSGIFAAFTKACRITL